MGRLTRKQKQAHTRECLMHSAARVFARRGLQQTSIDEVAENAGFTKGFVHGNVGLSSKHTLAIVNRGGGTAREGLELVRMIQQKVREKFGVEIQPEPNFIGV